MLGLTQKKTFKIATLMVAIALLVPSAVTFSHIFSHHHHEICNGEPQTHIHKSDIDCDFYKFKLSASYTIPSISYEFIPVEDNHAINQTVYAFLSEYQRLHFSLRGPPQLI
ncbi:MAG: hypothetical protein ACSHXF_13635 [Aquaticitalea sp.]